MEHARACRATGSAMPTRTRLGDLRRQPLVEAHTPEPFFARRPNLPHLHRIKGDVAARVCKAFHERRVPVRRRRERLPRRCVATTAERECVVAYHAPEANSGGHALQPHRPEHEIRRSHARSAMQPQHWLEREHERVGRAAGKASRARQRRRGRKSARWRR